MKGVTTNDKNDASVTCPVAIVESLQFGMCDVTCTTPLYNSIAQEQQATVGNNNQAVEGLFIYRWGYGSEKKTQKNGYLVLKYSVLCFFFFFFFFLIFFFFFFFIFFYFFLYFF